MADCLARLGAGDFPQSTADVHELGRRAAAADIAVVSPSLDIRGVVVSRRRSLREDFSAGWEFVMAELIGAMPPSVAVSRATRARLKSPRIGQPGDQRLRAAAEAAWDACGRRAPVPRMHAGVEQTALLQREQLHCSEATALLRQAHAIATLLRARPLFEALWRLAHRARRSTRTTYNKPTSRSIQFIQRLELT